MLWRKGPHEVRADRRAIPGGDRETRVISSAVFAIIRCSKDPVMHRLTPLCCSALLLVAATVPANGQASDTLAALLARNQYDLAVDGRQFLLKEMSKASFVLVGGLHGDNETQALLQMAMAGLADGPTLIITEMSPWAANRLFATAPDDAGVRLRGADIEDAQLPLLIRELAAAKLENRTVQEMAALVENGYRRSLARDLLNLARQVSDVRGGSPGGVPLVTLLIRTLEVETDRSSPETAGLPASLRRERVMKDFFLTHYREAAAAGGKPKVAAVFGRNHLHRGIDRRGVSTLGNFIAELAVAEGAGSFNVALFAAGGTIALGGTREIDERKDDPAFGFLASAARQSATVFDMAPLREGLRNIPAAERTLAQSSLLYWADSYDAVICYRQVTPLGGR
ncbi:MAG TPA: hypothetical protein VMN03_08370 [Burkholderiales bacterium]|nr:hypothetical protein [Burkholderiales bacterium]